MHDFNYKWNYFCDVNYIVFYAIIGSRLVFLITILKITLELRGVWVYLLLLEKDVLTKNIYDKE